MFLRFGSPSSKDEGCWFSLDEDVEGLTLDMEVRFEAAVLIGEAERLFQAASRIIEAAGWRLTPEGNDLGHLTSDELLPMDRVLGGQHRFNAARSFTLRASKEVLGSTKETLAFRAIARDVQILVYGRELELTAEY